MLTIYNDKGKKILVMRGSVETSLRSICEESVDPKTTKKIFSKKTDDVKGLITFKSLSNTEAKTTQGYFYLWKNYVLDFLVS